MIRDEIRLKTKTQFLKMLRGSNVAMEKVNSQNLKQHFQCVHTVYCV